MSPRAPEGAGQEGITFNKYAKVKARLKTKRSLVFKQKLVAPPSRPLTGGRIELCTASRRKPAGRWVTSLGDHVSYTAGTLLDNRYFQEQF